MAADCTPQTLITDSRCLAAAMGERQLLASIAYSLAVLAGSDTDPQSLITQSECLWTAMSERQLLAAVVYLQCQLNG